MELDSSMQLFFGLVPPPTLTAHLQKYHGVDVDRDANPLRGTLHT